MGSGDGVSSLFENDPVLADLFESVALRLRRGEAVDQEALIEAHPERAEQLRRVVPAMEVLAEMGRMVSPNADMRRAGVVGGVESLGTLGDFRLLREIGHGGMGIVYEAEQLSLDRRVALKVLPFAAAADPKQQRRFRLEAQAAALLHHTNIVPVFSVGCDRGVHYYAMQYIEGRTLAKVVEELRHLEGLDVSPTVSAPAPSRLLRSGNPPPDAPTVEFRLAESDEPIAVRPTSDSLAARAQGKTLSHDRSYIRSVAQLGIQAAEALAYAHDQDVVHRDIKPPNLLLDTQGRLWITDFGLARLRGGAGSSLSGVLVGTLRYMSPEQAQVHRATLDHRTDIYSLGVTLYELLTLRPAIAGTGQAEILRGIAEVDPTPIRRLNQDVPRDLETIIQKAMAKEASDRFPTAQALADDLRRFLDDKPIKARPPGLLERAAKWGRRHRSLVAAGIIFLVCSVIGLGISTALIARAYRNESQQRRLAGENFQIARQVVDEMYTGFVEDWLENEPAMDTKQRDILEKAASYYERFTDVAGDDPTIRRNAATTYLRLAMIEDFLGQEQAAMTALGKAIEILEDLISQNDAERRAYQYDLAVCHSRRGLALMDHGYPDLAVEDQRRAINLAENLRISAPADRRYALLLAECFSRLSNALRRTNQLAMAGEAGMRAVNLSEWLVEQDPDNIVYQRVLGQSLIDYGAKLKALGQLDEAEPILRRSLQVREGVASAEPEVPHHRRFVAHSLAWLGGLLSQERRYDESEPIILRALSLHEEMAASFPDRLIYKEELADVVGMQAFLLAETGRYHEAIPLVSRELGLREAIYETTPDLPDVNWDLARAENQLAWNLISVPEHLDRDLKQGVALARKAVERFPDQGKYWNTLGVAYYRDGQDTEALRALGRSDELLGETPYNLYFLSMAHQRLGEVRLARQFFEKAAIGMYEREPENRELHRIHDEASEALTAWCTLNGTGGVAFLYMNDLSISELFHWYNKGVPTLGVLDERMPNGGEAFVSAALD